MKPAAGHRAFVGIGANLGDTAAAMRAAVQALAMLSQTRLIAVSSLYRSAPVDAPGPQYLNAVAEIDTRLDALSLLQRLLAIEQMQGRVRGERHAPRTLDLDLLLFDDLRQQRVELTLPHPRMHLRAFVLRPLAEIAPELELPQLGPIGPWLERCADQPIEKL